jgi:transcription elongation GreA/GreB family factor
VKLDPKVRSKLESGRFDDVDDMWVSKLAESAQDLEFFAPIVRALLQREQAERATLLVQLWLDAQREHDDGEHELVSVRTMLAVWPASQELRDALLATLRRRYGDRPSLETLIDHFELPGSADSEQAVQSLEAWLRYDVGQLVAMAKLGVGQVSQINLALGTLRVDFDTVRESFRIAEAQQLLQPLEPGHFLLQKRQRRDELQSLANDDPGELLRRLFASLGSPLATTAVRDHLRDLVPASSWSTWWKRARTEARLTVGTGARASCTWNDSPAEAQDQLLEVFENASDRQKLDMVRQHARRSPAVGRALAHGLVRLLDAGARASAVSLEAALLLDELHDTDAIGADGALGSWSPGGTRSHLQEQLAADDATTQIAALRDRRARERAIALACELRPNPGPLLRDLVQRESDARSLSLLYGRLRRHDEDGLLESTIRDALSAPHNAPHWYVWLCRELTRREELAHFADWRFLRGLLEACDSEALRGQRPTLRALFEPGGVAVRSVESLDRSQAAQLLLVLEREMGVEEHRKDNVRRAVWERFPDLEQRDEQDLLYVTPESLERKRAAFEQLIRFDIPRNTEEIRKAAAHGDLRENFEYKSARERHEMLSSRAKSMHEELRRARALDPESIDTSVVRVGTRVQLQPAAGGDVRTLTILGPWDSDPAAGIVSYLAPAVAELLGKRLGERVRFADAEFSVGAIDVWKR